MHAGTSGRAQMPIGREIEILCVDDEPLILGHVLALCREMPGGPRATGFERAEEALGYLRFHHPDVAILDINMPDMDGLLLAAKIKESSPDTAILFLTGHSEYAVDAFALHATGYLLKPVNRDRLALEVAYALSLRPRKKLCHIEVQTFGRFQVLADGRRVDFSRSKAGELLAYLVDRQGRWVRRQDIFYALWEEGTYDRGKQKQLDVVIRSLRTTLTAHGISEIMEMDRGRLRAVPGSFGCDLYRFLEGDMEAVDAYRGEYMADYSWASLTEAWLDRKTLWTAEGMAPPTQSRE